MKLFLTVLTAFIALSGGMSAEAQEVHLARNENAIGEPWLPSC